MTVESFALRIISIVSHTVRQQRPRGEASDTTTARFRSLRLRPQTRLVRQKDAPACYEVYPERPVEGKVYRRHMTSL